MADKKQLQQAARAAKEVAAKWADRPGREARDITAISQLMADRYVDQLAREGRK